MQKELIKLFIIKKVNIIKKVFKKFSLKVSIYKVFEFV